MTRAEQIIGYAFTDKNVLWEALQVAGSGVLRIDNRPVTDGNKRLAIWGDRLGEQVISAQWYNSGDPKGGIIFPNCSKPVSKLILSTGKFDRARQAIMSNPNLAAAGTSVGLQDCLNSNPKNPVAPGLQVMAALVEAILAAIYIDTGYDIGQVGAAMGRLGLSYEAYLAHFEAVTFSIFFPSLPMRNSQDASLQLTTGPSTSLILRVLGDRLPTGAVFGEHSSPSDVF